MMASSATDKGLPLGAWLAWGAAALAVTAVAVTGWLAWNSGQRAVQDLADQLQRRASAQVEEHLRAYLAAPQRVIRLMAHAVQQGEVDLAKPDTVYRFLWRLADIYDSVSYLNFGLEDGHFYGLGRIDPDSPQLHIEETEPPDMSRLYRYPLDAQGQRLPLSMTLPFDNFHEQVWYAQPKSLGLPTWTDIYNWEEAPSVIVVGAGQPMYDDGGQLLGVAGVDLFLGEITNFLGDLHVSPNARTFLVDRQGLLVATSTDLQPFRLGPQGAQRLSPLDVADESIQVAARHMIRRPGGLMAIGAAYTDSYQWRDTRYFLRVTPWRDRYGLDWLIAVAVPEGDFSQTIDANNRITLAVAGGVMLLALVVAVLAARLVTRPIDRLDRAARAIAAGRLDTQVSGSSFREFNRLAESFNTMARQLKSLFLRAEQTQSQLEQQIVQRTEELWRANVELEHLSQVDSLTQLANRRRFDPQLRDEWQRARRSGNALALVICDIDHFKEYNDRFGHLHGDQALRQVAATLAAVISRAGDLAARFGGEEFVLLLPGTDQEGALRVFEEVRKRVRELALPHAASVTGLLTLSAGVACMDAAHPYAVPEQLLEAADQALYAAKAAGRDRINVAPLS